MTDLSQILADHGLEHLEAILLEHRIDLDVLDQISEGDLESIGLALGDRKRFLSLIAAEKGIKTKNADGREANDNKTAQSELRQITVLFADLVGSTKLAAEHDVEENHAVLAGFHKFCSDVIRDHGGTAERFIGDALLGCFGYPFARENDAARAVLAAEQIAREAPRIPLSIDHTPQARVGVATGVAMTGDLITDGRSAFGPATGPVLNLAARLQSLATPGRVLIDKSTRDLTPPHFSCAFIGAQELKGFAEPQPLWRIDGIGERAPLLRSNSLFGAEPLVGRAPEIATLERCWDESDRKGSFVLITGEAGIGKTRIVNEFILRAQLPEDRVIRMECAADEQLRPLRPVIAFLESRFGNARAADAPSRAEALRRWIVDDMKLSPHAADIIERLIAPEEAAPVGGEAPRDRKAKLFETLTLLLERMGLDRPNVFLIEDVHWIDPTTQEFLDHLVERIAPMKAMVICTYRPDHQPNFIGQPRVNLISLSRLEAEQSAEIMRNVLGDGDLPPDLESEIVARAEGVPFFVEELTRSAVETDTDLAEVDAERRARRLPTTLHGSLLARLDRVPGVNRLAPIGAALGRTFSKRLLLEVAELEDGDATPIIDGLLATGLLIQSGLDASCRYTFKHALVQDAAYSTMPRSRRVAVHQRIANALVKASSNEETVSIASLAWHFSRAESHERAREYWQTAALDAIKRFANLEACAYFTAALEDNNRLDASVGRDLREIEIRESLMIPLGLTAWGSPAIDENLESLFKLQNRSGDPSSLFQILAGQCGAQIMAGQIERALTIAKQLAEFAEPNTRPEEGVVSVHYTAMCNFFLGRMDRAVDLFDKEISLMRASLLPAIQKHYAADPSIVARCMQAWAFLITGERGRAQKRISESLNILSISEENFNAAYGYGILAACHQTIGDAEMTVQCARSSLALSRETPETRIPYWEAWSQILLGWGVAASNGRSDGADLIRKGIKAYVATGARQILPYAHALLADALVRTNRPDAGRVEMKIARELRSTSDVSVFDFVFPDLTSVQN